jgi:hypothetical protein
MIPGRSIRSWVAALACAVLAGRPVVAQQPVDWQTLTDESVRVLGHYLKINTTNPPGNELAGARFLKEILEREGIEATADVDIRLLPDADPAVVLATLKRVVADTAVTWTPLLAPKTPLENPIETELFRAIERISLANVGFGVRYLYDILRYVQ